MKPGADRASILFVCTANECRSPFAAALARREVGDGSIDIDSAGVQSWRRGVPETGLAHASALGLDLTGHVSASVHDDSLADYDVILGMSREHIRELAARVPDVRARLFTVKQFDRWLDAHERPRRARLGPWLDAVAGDRPASDFVGASAADDVADPMGKPLASWRAMTDELAPLIGSIMRRLEFAPRV